MLLSPIPVAVVALVATIVSFNTRRPSELEIHLQGSNSDAIRSSHTHTHTEQLDLDTSHLSSHFPARSCAMSSEAEQKRRPPPIQIPEHRVIPGPNAFALAAKAKQQAEKGKEDASFHTPKASPLENPEHLEPTTQIRRGGSHHGSVATNFGQIIDAARSSPRKSGQSSSTNSRHGSTARSRHSNRSHQSAASSQREHVEGESNKKKFVPSARQEIEAKSEKKLFRMMGQQPDTPTEGMYTSSR